MERTYKGHKISRSINGKWNVVTPKGIYSQHSTLSDAKEYVSNWA